MMIVVCHLLLWVCSLGQVVGLGDAVDGDVITQNRAELDKLSVTLAGMTTLILSPTVETLMFSTP